jgi:hypothetical protein
VTPNAATASPAIWDWLGSLVEASSSGPAPHQRLAEIEATAALALQAREGLDRFDQAFLEFPGPPVGVQQFEQRRRPTDVGGGRRGAEIGKSLVSSPAALASAARVVTMPPPGAARSTVFRP